MCRGMYEGVYVEPNNLVEVLESGGSFCYRQGINVGDVFYPHSSVVPAA